MLRISYNKFVFSAARAHVHLLAVYVIWVSFDKHARYLQLQRKDGVYFWNYAHGLRINNATKRATKMQVKLFRSDQIKFNEPELVFKPEAPD